MLDVKFIRPAINPNLRRYYGIRGLGLPKGGDSGDDDDTGGPSSPPPTPGGGGPPIGPSGGGGPPAGSGLGPSLKEQYGRLEYQCVGQVCTTNFGIDSGLIHDARTNIQNLKNLWRSMAVTIPFLLQADLKLYDAREDTTIFIDYFYDDLKRFMTVADKYFRSQDTNFILSVMNTLPPSIIQPQTFARNVLYQGNDIFEPLNRVMRQISNFQQAFRIPFDSLVCTADGCQPPPDVLDPLVKQIARFKGLAGLPANPAVIDIFNVIKVLLPDELNLVAWDKTMLGDWSLPNVGLHGPTITQSLKKAADHLAALNLLPSEAVSISGGASPDKTPSGGGTTPGSGGMTPGGGTTPGGGATPGSKGTTPGSTTPGGTTPDSMQTATATTPTWVWYVAGAALAGAAVLYFNKGKVKHADR